MANLLLTQVSWNLISSPTCYLFLLLLAVRKNGFLNKRKEHWFGYSVMRMHFPSGRMAQNATFSLSFTAASVVVLCAQRLLCSFSFWAGETTTSNTSEVPKTRSLKVNLGAAVLKSLCEFSQSQFKAAKIRRIAPKGKQFDLFKKKNKLFISYGENQNAT